MNKTIKIIDLLNKIANGEKVPKRIKYCDDLFALVDYGKDTKLYQLLEEPYEVLNINTSCLNDTVEIIEGNDKLEKIKWEEKESLAKPLMINDKVEVLARRTEKLKKKIADLIDHINKIEEKLDERI